MKAYICDACGEVIKDPYEENMKQFYVGVQHDSYIRIAFQINCTRKVKVDLCEECYKGLHYLANEKGGEKDG